MNSFFHLFKKGFRVCAGALVVVDKILGMKQKRRPAQGRFIIAANILASPFRKGVHHDYIFGIKI